MAPKMSNTINLAASITGIITAGAAAYAYVERNSLPSWFYPSAYAFLLVVVFAGGVLAHRWRVQKHAAKGADQNNMLKYASKIQHSGIIDYHDSFKMENGPDDYWTKVENRFCYLGCGGGSISNHLKKWIGEEQGANREYFILLMNPDGKFAERQICFNLGYSLPVSDPDKLEQVKLELAHLKDQYNTTLSGLRKLAAYKSRPQRLKIRVYDEFTPWWMYIMDRKSMVLGILRRNNVDKNREPAVILSAIKDQDNLFSSFLQNFERIWESAVPVEDAANGSHPSPSGAP